MPKDIVNKFCFFVSKCGQQVDIKGTIRDSYLFEVDWIFSFLLFWGVEMVLFGLYWYNLSEMMMISEEFLVQILSLQKSEVDEYISPCCIKLESKLMEQDKIKEEWYHRRVWVRYLWLSKEIEIWVFLLRISFSYWIGSILDGVTLVSSLGFRSFLHKGDARLRSFPLCCSHSRMIHKDHKV